MKKLETKNYLNVMNSGIMLDLDELKQKLMSLGYKVIPKRRDVATRLLRRILKSEIEAMKRRQR